MGSMHGFPLDYYFFHMFFFNVNIYPTPVWISVKLLPVINNSHMEGTVFQIFYIAPSFYFMIKNGKIVVIMFLTFTLHLKKKAISTF